MASIAVEFGHARTEKRSLSLTRADKDRILQNFPEKISVSVPGFGGQEFPLRAQVKAFLDHIQAPTVKATFEVSGKPDDIASVAIQKTDIKVLGVHAASFNVLDARVAYQFDVDVESEGAPVRTGARVNGSSAHSSSFGRPRLRSSPGDLRDRGSRGCDRGPVLRSAGRGRRGRRGRGRTGGRRGGSRSGGKKKSGKKKRKGRD